LGCAQYEAEESLSKLKKVVVGREAAEETNMTLKIGEDSGFSHARGRAVLHDV
jgi:hypothetical protein